ncbi:MAG: MarR family winged helix-turn-helix transcriptional regulator [Candidatus Dormibacteria bacterium]
MPAKSTTSYRFGDLLALARQSWVAQMAGGLASRGYLDYRRSDAAALRVLRRGPLPVGRLGQALGVTRQAARKVADGLERRGLASAARADHDSRQVSVGLTPAGEAYARAVGDVADRLNRDLCRRVDPAALTGAAAVLGAVLAGHHNEAPEHRGRRGARPADSERPTSPEGPGGTGAASA